MKNKGIKIALIASGSALVLGGILLGAGISLGGSPSFYFDEEGIHVKENTEVVPKENYVMEPVRTGTIRKLDLQLQDADIQIVSGDAWSVEYQLDSERQKPVYSFEDGVLTLKEGDYDDSGRSVTSVGIGDYWWIGQEVSHLVPYVKITVPEGGKLEEVSVSSRYGDVEIERKLYAKSAQIDVRDGSVRMEGWEGNDLEMELQYGSLTTGMLDGSNVIIASEDGNIKIGSLKADTADLRTEYGQLTVDVEKAENVDVESGDGGVTLYLVGGMDRYGVNLHTDYGTIRTPDGTVEPDESEGSSDFIQTEGDAAGIRVYTDYGDIRIREK